MLRSALLVFVVLAGISFLVAAPQFKSLHECQAAFEEYETWYEPGVGWTNKEVFSADYKKLAAENARLKSDLELSRATNNSNSAQGTPGLVVAVMVITGLTILLTVAFGLWQLEEWMKRNRLKPKESRRAVAPARRQLMVLVLGAIWISVAALIAVNDAVLSRHPVNMLFTVLVYSLPALLFSGIGFWWFGKPRQQEPAQ